MLKFKKERQIYLFIRYAPIFFILFLFFLITYFLYKEKQENFKNEIRNIENFYFKEHRELIKNKVDEVYEKIYYYSSKKDFDEKLKEHLLEEITRIKFIHGNGYIFVTDYDGNILVHADYEIVGKNKLDWKDENGFEIIKEIIKTAKNGDGYLNYGGVKKPTINLVSFKTTYVRGVNKLGWAIGAGFYNDDLISIIDVRKKEIEDKFESDIRNIFTFIVGFTILLIYLAIIISNALKEKFENYKNEIEEVEPYYFYSLENLVHVMTKQNVLRAICEAYIGLLEYEGRLHTDFECLLCELPIKEEVSIVRGFLPIHAKCTRGKYFENKKMKELFENKSTINLKDEEVEYLWDILLQGL